MSQSKLIAQNEDAIAAYRKARFDIRYQPASNNDDWFMRLMEKHDIPPAGELALTPGKISVLMVND